MPTIRLTDQLGAVTEVEAAKASALLRYFQALPGLAIGNADLSQVGGLTLDQPAVLRLRAGLSFADAIPMGDGLDLAVRAGANGSFSILSPGQADIEVPEGSRCLRVAFDAAGGVSPGAALGPLRFGIGPGADLEIANYVTFPTPGSVTLMTALRQAIGGFVIPARTADLEVMPEGVVATVTGEGSLKLSVAADLLALTNPLAMAQLPGPLPAVGVSAGGSVEVGASCRIAGEFQVRAHKLDGSRVQIGWYRTKSAEWTVTATATAGLRGGAGETDLFSPLLRAISANPVADSEEMKRAGLSEDQTETIQAAVRAAVERSVALALATELQSLGSDEAAFLFEADLAALTPASRDALDRALHGELSALHDDGLAGVACISSTWTKVNQRRVSLRVNLLGIYNFASVAELVRTGTVLWEPASGSLVLTDRITADRVRSAQVNFGADTAKLRRVLAESFLITAVYRGTERLAGRPSLACSHAFFDLRNQTSREDMRRSLRIGSAMGLWTGEDAELPDGVEDFGRTTVHARVDYDDALTTSLFLSPDGEPYPTEFYENAGRSAIQLLVGEHDQDAIRRKPAIDDDLWRQMKRLGQPSFGQVFPGLPAPLLGAIVADYSTIVWWADAMAGAAKRLAAMRQFLVRNPQATPDDPEFGALRGDLAAHLVKVVKTTREEFGQPWGLVAMNEASSRGAPASILILGPRLVRARDKVRSAGAGSTRALDG